MTVPTDYRAHSYSFAQGGLGCITLFAGLMFTLSAIPFWGERIPEAAWLSGLAVLSVAVAWMLAFASLRYVDRAERASGSSFARRDISISNAFMFITLVVALVAIVLLYLALRQVVIA